MKALVLIPTYNEKDNLPILVTDLMAIPGVSVMVLDDQSPDGTGKVADALGGSIRDACGAAPHRPARPRRVVSRRLSPRDPRPTPTSSARWTPTSRTIRSTCRR